jgi:hypothetical protein
MPAALEAIEALTSYVTNGSLRSDTQFDASFKSLEGLPPALRRTPSFAWRVLTLSEADHGLVMSGSVIRLFGRRFGSWTKDRRCVRHILRNRLSAAPAGSVTVVIRKRLPPGCCLVDVEAFYRAYGLDGQMPEWDLHVVREREIVLEQDEGMLTVGREDIVSAHPLGDIRVLKPRPGEMLFGEVEGRIETVVEGPLSRRADAAWVVVADGRRFVVAWDDRHGCWDGEQVPAPAP